MRIGIDVSQTAFQGTGVGNYLANLVEKLIEKDKKNKYVLFFSSLRRTPPAQIVQLTKNNNVTLKVFKFPPLALNLLWNKLHQIPVEKFTGDLDVFISSDWTQPPSKAKKATILYDLIVYTHPKETDQKIVKVQRKRLKWVRKEADIIFCISEATKKDASEILGIDKEKMTVIYPGI